MTIQFNHVSHIYQKDTPYEYQALSDINLEIEQGKYYAIVGQTGSSKSTLIQYFNGLLKPAKGSVTFDNEMITRETKGKHLRELRQRVGLILQFPELRLFEGSMEGEVVFGPRNFKMNVEQVKLHAYQLLLDLGFDHHTMEQSPLKMSSGQMRKIALVSVLTMEPNIIILDEFIAGLDPRSRQQVMELIEPVQVNHHKTVILISHDMGGVARYAKEIIVMRQGKVIEQCSLKSLFRQYERLRDWYIALPDVVQLQYDPEDKYQTMFNDIALDEDEFVTSYQEW